MGVVEADWMIMKGRIFDSAECDERESGIRDMRIDFVNLSGRSPG